MICSPCVCKVLYLNTISENSFEVGIKARFQDYVVDSDQFFRQSYQRDAKPGNNTYQSINSDYYTER